MKTNLDTQMDLLSDSPNRRSKSVPGKLLAVEVDHWKLMAFLNEEWLFPEEAEGILLGVEVVCEAYISQKYKTVCIWFDKEMLPDIGIMALREKAWVSTSLHNICPLDIAILWNGPIPLFAVDHFSVSSDETRAHLLAQLRNFADIQVPEQHFKIEQSSKLEVQAPLRTKFPFGAKKAPNNWDALRGAAAMAFECVPTIGPWLETLCDFFSHAQPLHSAEKVKANWLSFAPWAFFSKEFSGDHHPLWSAIILELSTLDKLNWRPDILLEDICSRALLLGGNPIRLEYLEKTTKNLLRDLDSIQNLGIKDDLLELSLQLLLLRNKPEKYVSWKKDWPSIPPGAWWTGAILSGYISGFRAIPLKLRGATEARKFSSLRTWKLADEQSFNGWNALDQGLLSWSTSQNIAHIKTEKTIISTYRLSNRGRWYELDLQQPNYEEQAKVIAREFCPTLLRKSLRLKEGTYKLQGTGAILLDTSQRELSIKGVVELPLHTNVELVESLDQNAFRDWLATSSLESLLPSPTESSELQLEDRVALNIKPGTTAPLPDKTNIRKNMFDQSIASSEVPPQGLIFIPNFITPKEEVSLLASIERHPWDTSMSRRVQHYGWQYDYRAKKVNPNSYLGPLPAWAQMLGKRLLKEKILLELPDQVIVNEYVGNQSISKHIDCLPCFRGAVVTISLLESWEMLFSRKVLNESDHKYRLILERRSAAILSGESRSKWYHEIPRRMKEAGISRERRISITLRKVNITL